MKTVQGGQTELPAPSGRIDHPVQGETISSDLVFVDGWATHGDVPATSVVVLLDGVPVAVALVNQMRPDVAIALGRKETDFLGFSCVIDVHNFQTNTVVDQGTSIGVDAVLDQRDQLRQKANLALVSVGSDGITSDVLVSIEVQIAPPCPHPEVRGGLELPIPGASIPLGLVSVSGWATWGTHGAPLVLVEVNGHQAGYGDASLFRPDVAEVLGDDTPENVGFNIVVDLDELGLSEGDDVEIVVSILGDLGRAPGFIDPETLGIGSVRGRVGPPDESIELKGRIAGRLCPEVHGGLELPVQGALIPLGSVSVSGWATWDAVGAPLVLVEVNGHQAGHGEANLSRPDVIEFLGPDFLDGAVSEDVGFNIVVDLVALGISEGDEVEIVVSALGDLGSTPGFIDPVALQIGRVSGRIGPPDESMDFQGSLDFPGEDDEVWRGPLNIRGWAFFGEGMPVSTVEVLAGGVSFGFARLGIPREDLVDVAESPLVAVSGFELLLDLRDLPKTEEVEFSVVATSIDGTTALIVERICRVTRDDKYMKLVDRQGDSKPSDEERRAETLSRREQTADLIQKDTRVRSQGLDLLAVTHDLGYGGGQLWLSELLIRAGAGRDFPCTVLAMRGGPLRGDLEAAGISVHVTGSVPVDDLESYEGRLVELELYARRKGVNAVLANTFSAYAGADLAVRMDLPCVWAIHESYMPSLYWDVAYPPNFVDALVRERVEEVLGLVDRVVFEAEATRKLYLKIVPDERAVVVRYGVNNAVIGSFSKRFSKSAARRKVGLSIDARVILVMGTTEPRKSQTFLAEAFAEVAGDYPEAHLVFVGATGTRYANALRTFVAKSGLSRQVTLAPVTHDIFTWYRSADVLVSASDVESLPRSILEAMSFGLPVAAASVFGIPELLTDASTGFLFKPRDLNAAVEVLRRVLEASRETLNIVGNAARELVTDSYDSSGYASELKTLLRDVVDRRT